jgi:hypothetical protein
MAYINAPTALWYGMFLMTAYWAVVAGFWEVESLAFGSIGVERGFDSSKPKQRRIESI